MKYYIVLAFMVFSIIKLSAQKGCFDLSGDENGLDVIFIATEDINNFAAGNGTFRLVWDRDLGSGAFSGASGGTLSFTPTGSIREEGGSFVYDFAFFNPTGQTLNLSTGQSVSLASISLNVSSSGGFSITNEFLADFLGFVDLFESSNTCNTEVDLVLPIELTSFTAAAENNSSLLSWATASEINNDYFSIEHSINGSEFVEIGQVGGAGTTTQTQNYSFTHANPTSGANYYRLKQVDFDEAFEYSEVEVVTFSNVEVENVKIFPNPADNFLVINAPKLSNLNVDLEVYDVKGKLLLHKNYDAFSISQHLEIDELPAGQYFIKLEADNQSLIERFTITR